MKKVVLIAFSVLAIAVAEDKLSAREAEVSQQFTSSPAVSVTDLSIKTVIQAVPYELSIRWLKEHDSTGSDLKIEKELEERKEYRQFIASYRSDGLVVFGLLTIPKGIKPDQGWPVIIFNHGYIPSKEYKTTERYGSHVEAFAKAGYIVFKPDYRGHGESEGEANGAYGTNDYSVDILNAVNSLRRYPDADQNKIGMWGHSMGGFLTLRVMVVDYGIRAGVIWGGVVADYQDLLQNWHRKNTPQPSPSGIRLWRDIMAEKFGSPENNPTFWHSLSANYYLNDISGPIQLHHSIKDAEVPVEFSIKLEKDLKNAGKEVELYEYSNDNHNISVNFSTAINRSVDFFDRYLKN